MLKPCLSLLLFSLAFIAPQDAKASLFIRGHLLNSCNDLASSHLFENDPDLGGLNRCVGNQDRLVGVLSKQKIKNKRIAAAGLNESDSAVFYLDEILILVHRKTLLQNWDTERIFKKVAEVARFVLNLGKAPDWYCFQQWDRAINEVLKQYPELNQIEKTRLKPLDIPEWYQDRVDDFGRALVLVRNNELKVPTTNEIDDYQIRHSLKTGIPTITIDSDLNILQWAEGQTPNLTVAMPAVSRFKQTSFSYINPDNPFEAVPFDDAVGKLKYEIDMTYEETRELILNALQVMYRDDLKIAAINYLFQYWKSDSVHEYMMELAFMQGGYYETREFNTDTVQQATQKLIKNISDETTYGGLESSWGKDSPQSKTAFCSNSEE